jgi:hypothetical protein
MYKYFPTQTDEDGNEVYTTIIRSDDALIPMVEGNTDYQDVLAWVAEGNTIEPADE